MAILSHSLFHLLLTLTTAPLPFSLDRSGDRLQSQIPTERPTEHQAEHQMGQPIQRYPYTRRSAKRGGQGVGMLMLVVMGWGLEVAPVLGQGAIAPARDPVVPNSAPTQVPSPGTSPSPGPGTASPDISPDTSPTPPSPPTPNPIPREPATLPSPWVGPTQGREVLLNNRALTLPWRYQAGTPDTKPSLELSDVALQQIAGLALLDTEDPGLQPVRWTPLPWQGEPQVLTLRATWVGTHRYLDIQPLLDQAGWQVQLQSDSLASTQAVPHSPRLALNLPTLQLPPLLQPMVQRAQGFQPLRITWAPGLVWQQRYVRLGSTQFPVTLLRFNPRQPGLSLKPIWTTRPTMAGIAPLATTAQLWQATASINAGFFNRNNRLPLGAIKRDGLWYSGPILNRGAIAWDDQGNVTMDRLSLDEFAIAGSDRFPITALNSGYVRAGLARYTGTWGPTYTPLTDNEILISVQNGVVTGQQQTEKAGSGSYAIPLQGSLLVARSFRTAAQKLSPGTAIQISQPNSPRLNDYPHILGAGPLLVQNQQIVLNAAAEQFSAAFIREKAVRSAVLTLADGSLLLATVHERVGGPGPTLDEMAQIAQDLGAIHALNLDGGSSTQLYLGGQLINRPPASAARVHNGLGLFLMPTPPVSP